MITSHQNTPKFEKLEIYPGLCVIKESNSTAIVGYINFHPFDKGWFYFIKDFVSDFFNDEKAAIDELIIHFLEVKLDTSFDRKGLLNNEKYVQR